jgi:hypothetical protein
MSLRIRLGPPVVLLALLIGTALPQSATAWSYGGYSPSRSYIGHGGARYLYSTPRRYYRSGYSHGGHKYRGHGRSSHRSYGGYSRGYRSDYYGHKGSKRYYRR